jgi:flagellar biosynthetic protein FliS
MPNTRVYQEIARETAPPTLVVAHVLNRAIRYTSEAEEAIPAGDIARAHDRLIRAQMAISALRTALRPAAAPDLVRNLEAVYAWAYDTLVDANVAKSADRLGDVQRVLGTLEAAWRDVGAPRDAATGRETESATHVAFAE